MFNLSDTVRLAGNYVGSKMCLLFMYHECLKHFFAPINIIDMSLKTEVNLHYSVPRHKYTAFGLQKPLSSWYVGK